VTSWGGCVVLLSGKMIRRASSYYTLSLARELARRRLDVEVIGGSGPMWDEFSRARLHGRAFEHIEERFRSLFKKRAVLEHLRNVRAGILHVQHLTMARFGRGLARRLNIPMVVTVHSSFRRRHARALQGQNVKVIAVSEPLREDLVNIGRVPKDKIVVIPNGLDLADYRASPPLRNGTTPVVGIIGPLVRLKGQAYFLKAAQRLLELERDIQFLIVGSGPDEKELRKLTARLGIQSNVTFAVGISRHRSLIETIDIFVFPSFEEGLGFNVLEAMASGRPVVASSVGGVYSVVRDEETGYLVDKGDVAAMVDRTLRLLRNPQLAAEMGARARSVVEKNFDIRKVVDRTLEVYREVA